jgi:hypothetical protein
MSPQQLDDLVAPIALYPDPMLGQVLAASTYPLELVEAQQWLQANRGLQGTQLTDAARQMNWDPSVQALVAFPDVLAKLNQNVQWTTSLGNAFLAQQADVMAAVQRMRSRAQARGRLSSNQQQVVTNDQNAIVIQPASPDVIYVPTYDPAYIWGPPMWGYYPDLYYPAFGFGFYPGFNVGLCFGGWGGGWGGWGWGPNWYGGGLFVNGGFFNRYGYGFGRFGAGVGFAGRGAWAHDPGHRLGVAYPNRALSSRFQAASAASRMNAGRFNGGARNSFGSPGSVANRGMAAQGGGRSFGSPGGQSVRGNAAQQGNWQRFQGSGNQGVRGNVAPQGSGRSFQAPGNQGYRGGAAPQSRSYEAPRQSYQAPRQNDQAPRQNFQAAPHYSAPAPARSSGGGGSAPRSFGGGGGGGGHVSGGGGGGHRGR